MPATAARNARPGPRGAGIMKGTKQETRGETGHSHFTQVPHLVDDMELSLAAFRLYVHLKRVTGDNEGGLCWEGQDRLADICRMNTKTVVRAKKELAAAGLIKIETDIKGGRPRHIIKVIDVWDKNQANYIEVKELPRGNLTTDTEVKELPLKGEKNHRLRSKRAIVRRTNEEEPVKKNHRRKTNSRRVLQNAKRKRL